MTDTRIAYAFHTIGGNCALGLAADYPGALHVEAAPDLYEAVRTRTNTSVESRIQIAIVGGVAMRADYMERGVIRVEPTRRDRHFAEMAEKRARR